DGGELPNYRLATLLRRGARADGLGLGLAIVRHLLRRLGGRLTLSGPPTTFTLTLPCQLWSGPESCRPSCLSKTRRCWRRTCNAI
ncbi:MAG: ATP-binding protein, partial [Aeromonas veronii]